MQTQLFSLLSRLFMMTSLLAGLLFGGPADSVKPVTPNDSPGNPVSASAPAAVSAASLLTIPEVAAGTSSPKANGDCSPTEYTGALVVGFTDGPGGTGSGQVFLIHDANYLYMCIVSPVGTDPARFDSLYLDPQGDGTTYTYAKENDFSLRLDFGVPSSKSTFRGNGLIGGWQDSSAADNSLWDGRASTGNFDMAEYSLPLANFNISVCNTIFGLAGYHHWFSYTGDDYAWPSSKYYDQPGTWQPVVLGSATCGQSGSIAYVFRNNTDDATSFYNLLTSAGYTVTLVPLGDVLTTDFNLFDMTIIANDTGSLNEWGTLPVATGAAQVAQIIAPNRPILGLGEGGYAFFGRLSLFIGWPRGWHGPQNFLTRAVGFPAAIFSGVSSDPVQTYTAPTNSVGIYLLPSVPVDVTPIAMEDPLNNHASQIQQGCRMLWGNSGNPSGMTASPNGTLLFLNSVDYIHNFNCPKVPPPPDTCGYTIEKTASPTAGSLVAPGSTIVYTLTYQLIDTQGCPTTGELVDSIPVGTSFIPGSATDGISPGADGMLVWTVSTSPAPLTKTFKVQVMDTACTSNKVISNVAELRPTAGTPLTSTPATTHNVDCPPIGLPNAGPMFAEDELKADPYPLVAGTPSHLSVRVRNLTGSSLPVTVQFQIAPAATPLGTGLAYTTIATKTASIPGLSTIELIANFIPDTSGNRCFQAVVSTPGMANPLVTQSCLDLTEDFQPGTTDNLVLVIRNNSSSAKVYNLVVDNTCPGWSATVDPTVTGSLAPGASQNVTLSVTPPDPLTMGSGCHIDLQAWDGMTLVGGVRKMDYPPVHLPVNVIPPWEEPEITFIPNPPVAGVAGQICIQLQNPLSVSKVVTVNFSVADFGAGIGFTPAASLTNITLPANSLATYCASWTPETGGTLHRCALATLVQPNSMDQTSQHNLNVVRPLTGDLSGLSIPFVVGNPGLADRGLGFDISLVGIDPLWVPVVLTPAGDPPPTMLAGGSVIPLVLRFTIGPAGLSTLAPQVPSSYSFGDSSSIEVTELLDGEPGSGFSVIFEPYRVYLPLIWK
jgi:hypothetical protein